MTSTAINFLTSGVGGMIGWIIVHPFNTIAVRMNLSASKMENRPKLLEFAVGEIRKEGILSLYSGLSAGLTRQLFYATSRFGFFEVFRDKLAKYRKTDIWSRLLAGTVSGALGAFIACPAEVALVRISNDSTLPPERRRNYKGLPNAFGRIMLEEGPLAFFSGAGALVNRAMVVGAIQVGTYDQFRETYRKLGVSSVALNVFAASMTSGFIYSVLSMPLETCKNRMAFQESGGNAPVGGSGLQHVRRYSSTLQTLRLVAEAEGAPALWRGFAPYYLRCGGHTVAMFSAVEALRKLYITYTHSAT